jgi:hypothetical protein
VSAAAATAIGESWSADKKRVGNMKEVIALLFASWAVLSVSVPLAWPSEQKLASSVRDQETDSFKKIEVRRRDLKTKLIVTARKIARAERAEKAMIEGKLAALITRKADADKRWNGLKKPGKDRRVAAQRELDQANAASLDTWRAITIDVESTEHHTADQYNKLAAALK